MDGRALMKFRYGTALLMKSVLLFSVFQLAASAPAHSAELTKELCRESDDTDRLADCLEKRIYDPCVNAGGSGLDVLCVTARKRVAERRIERATAEITRLSRAAGVVPKGMVDESGKEHPARDHTPEANLIWREYVREHCSFLTEIYSANLSSGERYGFCDARLMEERAVLLEQILAGMRSSER
jgi:hypothetical protein